MRSVWKGAYVNFRFNNKYISSDSNITIDKNVSVLSKFVNLKVSLYNGKLTQFLQIKREMVGFKFGEFVLTRKYGVTHKKKVRNIMKKNKK